MSSTEEGSRHPAKSTPAVHERRAADSSITRLHSRMDDLFIAVNGGFASINQRLADNGTQIAALQVSAERREAELKALNLKMDGARADDSRIRDEHERRITELESFRGMLKTATRAGQWISRVMAAMVTGLALGLVAWVIKKTTGHDIAPWLHLGNEIDGK